MTLSSKDQFDGLMKLKKEIELIQFLKELDNQFKNLNNQFKKSVYEESELTDELAAAKDAEERVAIQEDLEAVEKEIKSFDDFVERNMIAIAEAEVMEA